MVKKWTSKESRAERYQELKRLGIDENLRKKARDWGQKRYNNLITEKKETNKRESLLDQFEIKPKKREQLLELPSKEFNRRIKKEEKNYNQRQRYHDLIKKGATPEQAKRGSSSEKKFESILDVLPYDPRLFVFWKEKSEYDDPAFLHRMIREGRTRSKGNLISDINYWKKDSFGLIGQVEVEIVTSKKEEKRVMNQYAGWHLIYNHKGKQYSPLLTMIRAVILSVYDDFEKELFIESVIEGLEIVSPDMAKKLRKDLQ